MILSFHNIQIVHEVYPNSGILIKKRGTCYVCALTILTTFSALIFSFCFRITKMIESGLIDRWIEEHFTKNLCANEGKIIGGQVATLSDIYGALIFLNFGLFCGTIAFLMERHFKQKWNLLAVIRHTFSKK